MPSTEAGVSGLVDNNTIDMIWNAIREKKGSGPDYNVLIEKANALSGLITDETMRLQGAFGVLKTDYPGLTKGDLLKSIEECIKVVDEQKSLGLSQCESKRAKEVEGRRAEAKKYEDEANEILKKIEDLRKNYDETLETARRLSNEAANIESEINQQKQVFENSVQAVMNKLNLDKTKVSNLSA
jgi:vacuolar-type H+-ATPase subunit I/STV1